MENAPVPPHHASGFTPPVSQSETLAYAAPLQSERCPICDRGFGRKRPLLYGVPVCKRCRNGLANRRQAAYILDSILWNLAAAIPAWVLLWAGSSRPDADLFIEALGWVISFSFIFKDGFSGMSPGKWLLDVQVVDVITREPISFGRSLKRNLITLIPFIVIIPAFQMIKGPRWGDGWARTAVIRGKYAHKLPFDPRGFLCTGCGYNLTGNVSGICPECGTPVPRGTAIPPAETALPVETPA
jgi:uncharacterized RDD family membrane protein YckC